MTNSENIRGAGRRGGKARKQRSAIRAQFDSEHEVLGVLTGQVPVRSMPIAAMRCCERPDANNGHTPECKNFRE